MKIISEKKKNIMERLDAMLDDLEKHDRKPTKIILTEGEALSFVELLNNRAHKSDLLIFGIRQLDLSYKCIPIEVE